MRRKTERAVNVTPALLEHYPLPVAAAGSKDERGAVFVVAGSPEVPGAAVLAATAALRAGAGKLQVATAKSIATLIGITVPEALVIGTREHSSGAIASSCARDICRRANKVDALVFGPGMVQNDECDRLLQNIITNLTVPAILDAAALTCARKSRGIFSSASAGLILTPHAGEMAALLSISREEVEASPAAAAIAAAKRFACVVALKGAQTYIGTAQGELFCNRIGTIGLATSGSGDTLAGIIGGLLARGLSPLAATLWGVYVHARAGSVLSSRVGVGFLARELLAEIPPVLRGLATRRAQGHTVTGHSRHRRVTDS